MFPCVSSRFSCEVHSVMSHHSKGHEVEANGYERSRSIPSVVISYVVFRSALFELLGWNVCVINFRQKIVVQARLSTEDCCQCTRDCSPPVCKGIASFNPNHSRESCVGRIGKIIFMAASAAGHNINCSVKSSTPSLHDQASQIAATFHTPDRRAHTCLTITCGSGNFSYTVLSVHLGQRRLSPINNSIYSVLKVQP